MRFNCRSSLVLALLPIAFAAACDSNRSPTTPAVPLPAPPAPETHEGEVLYVGTVQLKERQARSADPRHGCVLDRLRADYGRVEAMRLAIAQPDLPRSEGDLQSGLFAVEGTRVYRSDQTLANIALSFSSSYPPLNSRYVDGCPPIGELEAVIFDLALPPIENGAIRGSGHLYLRLVDHNWSAWDPEPNSEFAIAVEVDLPRQ